jgi:hypothetical protein
LHSDFFEELNTAFALFLPPTHCRARAEYPGAYDFSMAAGLRQASYPARVSTLKSQQELARSARASYPRFSIWKFGNGFWCLGKKMRIDLGLNIYAFSKYPPPLIC